jgi:SAM-dependent methyltransferase
MTKGARFSLKFYEMLVKHYDDVFPMSQDTYGFIREDLKPGDKVLDVACGTGTYTIPLQKEGVLACGLDLEETMIEQAVEKAEEENVSGDFVVSNMLNIDLVSEGDLRRIYIIGNSLVHLKSMDEVRSFLSIAYDLLNDEGDLIIQIINYDRILSLGIDHLPTIEVPGKGITFERNYNYDVSSSTIEFASRLNVLSESKESSVYLLPIRKDDLLKELENVGFKDISVYGNFKKEPFTENSVPLIIKARKNI